MCSCLADCLNALVRTEEDAQSCHRFADKALRVFFAFFDQFEFTPPLFTTQVIREVGFGNVTPVHCPTSNSPLVLLGGISRIGGNSAILSIPSFSPVSPISLQLQRLTRVCASSRSLHRVFYARDFPPRHSFAFAYSSSSSFTLASLGFGTISSITSLSQFSIAVLFRPTPTQRTYLERCGFTLHPLLRLFHQTPTSLFVFLLSSTTGPRTHSLSLRSSLRLE